MSVTPELEIGSDDTHRMIDHRDDWADEPAEEN